MHLHRRHLRRVLRNVLHRRTLYRICRRLHKRRNSCRSAACRGRLTLQIHSRCGKSCARLRRRMTRCATKKGRGKAKCLRKALRRLRKNSCRVIGINEDARKPTPVAPVVVAAELRARCTQLRDAYTRRGCHTTRRRFRSRRCRRLRRQYNRRCGSKCHELRESIGRCTAGRGPAKASKCLLDARRRLKRRKCAVAGISAGALPSLKADLLTVALPIGLPGPLPWARDKDIEVDDHDEYAADGGRWGGDGVGSGSGSGSDSNGPTLAAGVVAVRSATSTDFPDRTLFIIIISLLAFVVLALLVGLIVLAFYCRRPDRKPKTQVDGLPKEFDEALLDKGH